MGIDLTINGPKKKVKIELEDAEGGKYNLSLEGNISREKIVKVFEFMELLNIEQPNEGQTQTRPSERGPASVGARIWTVVETKLPYTNFTSSDVLELYEDQYNEPIKLSIISTYLSRYSERGRLVRNRHGKEWVYKLLRLSQPNPGGAIQAQTRPGLKLHDSISSFSDESDQFQSDYI